MTRPAARNRTRMQEKTISQSPKAEALGARSASGRVARGTAAYAAAAVAQRSVGFLLLPLYARVLAPSEYGQIGVITAITAALGTILGLGLETAIFRARVRYADQPAEAHTFVNTVGGFALGFPVSVALVLSLAVGPMIGRAFDVPVDALAAAFIGTGLSVSATVVPLALLRSEERLRDYLRLTGIQVFLTTSLTLLLVVVVAWGVTGWMLANAMSSALLLGRGIKVLHHRWSANFQLRYLREALVYGLPLVPHAFSHWALALSDRAVLGAFVDPAQIGAYYVAYQFALPITVVAIAVSQGVQPLYAHATASSASRLEIAGVTTHQALLVGFMVAIVGVVGPAALVVLLPSTYADAAEFIPWIALGLGLFGLYLMPMNAVAVMAGRTRWIWTVTLTAGVANVGLNLAFVPRFGALAAAVNTSIGYAILLGGMYVYMRRVCDPPIPYQLRRTGLGLVLIVLASTLAMILAPPEPLASLAVRSSVIVVIPILLIGSGLWRGIAGRARRRVRDLVLKR